MLVRFACVAAVLLSWVTTLDAHAQANEELIVVTGTRISADNDGGFAGPTPPYVSLKAPADFVIFTVQLESGTKDPAARTSELARTYERLVRRAASAQGVSIEVGSPGDSSPLETATAAEVIEWDYDSERGFIPLVLKFTVRENDRFAAVRTRAESFIEGIEEVGRVEAVTGDLQYAGISDAGRHREALMRKIATDTQLLQSIFAGQGGVQPGVYLSGLEGRVQYRPAGPLELELFVPYSVFIGTPLAR